MPIKCRFEIALLDDARHEWRFYKDAFVPFKIDVGDYVRMAAIYTKVEWTTWEIDKQILTIEMEPDDFEDEDVSQMMLAGWNIEDGPEGWEDRIDLILQSQSVAAEPSCGP